ncbi:MAG: CHAD domain-containing protein [Gemmatimonadaceae bacterium]|nr:CHAD domain-containing protein [Gemmatimonadaceae bacterium]
MPDRPLHPTAEDLLAGSAARSTRLICRQLVAKAAAAAAGLDDGGRAAVEARHDFRVALRELRTTIDCYAAALEGAEPETLVRKIRALAKRIGSARDADVQNRLWRSVSEARTVPQRAALERLAPLGDTASAVPFETGAIHRRWRRLQSRLHETVNMWHEKHRLEDDGTAITFSRLAADALEQATVDLSDRFATIGSADDAPALHAARLAVKRVRYLLKPLAGDDTDTTTTLSALRDAQDLLGAINDAHMLRARLRAAHPADSASASRITRAALAASDRDLTQRIRSAFAQLAPWCDAEARSARTAVLHATAARWRRGAAPPMEYERKWLLSALPPRVLDTTPALLRQGYLPGDALVERIRSITRQRRTEWIRTVKLGRGMARIEVEERTTAALGRALYALTRGRRVTKRRFDVPDGELTWEIDDFTDRDLVLAEIEFAEGEGDVQVPAWLAPWIVREVTDDVDFTNWKLAR